MRGAGLAGLVAARFARLVVLTDYDDNALALMQSNIEKNCPSQGSEHCYRPQSAHIINNGLLLIQITEYVCLLVLTENRPKLFKLIWEGNINEFKQEYPQPFDVVMASDVMYLVILVDDVM